MVPAAHAFKTDGFQRLIFTRDGGSSAQGVGSSARFLRGIMVPAAQAFKTNGFQRQIFRRGGGSSAPRRRFQRPILTRDRSSSGSCLQDRWVPAFSFCEGRWFQQATAWVTALHCDRAACRLADLPTCRFADLPTWRPADLPTCLPADMPAC